MNVAEHCARVRDALRVVLFVRARVRAQTGQVPVQVQARVHELMKALADCTSAVEEQQRRAAIEMADESAAQALAALEVERALS